KASRSAGVLSWVDSGKAVGIECPSPEKWGECLLQGRRPPLFLLNDDPPGHGRPVNALLPVEMRQGVSAANALHPESLIPGDVGRDVVVGDDHLLGERLVVVVAVALEVCEQDYGPGTPAAALSAV